MKLIIAGVLAVALPLLRYLSHHVHHTMTASHPARTPIYFIAHGGPPTVLDHTSAARKHWIKVASEIKSLSSGSNPSIRGIVFLSAHWQAEPQEVSHDANGILVNTEETNPLIYDFYGFPDELYKLQFHSHNPSWLNQLVANHLDNQGFSTRTTRRGIDHGVWVPLLPGFGENAEGLPPLVQISLPFSYEDQGKPPVEDGLRALRLGRALQALRDQGIAIIGGGQPVHNLGEMRKSMMDPLYQPGEFAHVFGDALSQAVIPKGNGAIDSNGVPARWANALHLFDHRYFKRAHPTAEHLLPALVCFGAAHDDEEGVQTFRNEQMTLGWAMYKWGAI